MPGTSDVAAESATSAHRDRTADSAKGPSHVPALLARVPRLGVWAWSFVGFVAASIIVFVALAAVSEIVLPLTFAAVLAVIFKPLVRILERHKVWPALAAGIVVLGLLALVTGVVIATVRGVTQQADQISGVADKALHKAADLTDAVGVDQSSLDALRKAIDDAAPMITTGVLAGLVSGIGTGSPHLCDAGGVCSADNRLDRTLAKRIARRCLGDLPGSALARREARWWFARRRARRSEWEVVSDGGKGYCASEH
jgi:hypothetical protein